jgi:PAS domain S-box-containing protein
MNEPLGSARRPEPAAQQGEERYRRILDNMLEGCAILSPDWTYLYVNEVNARHAHSTPQQMIGRCMFDLIPGVEGSPFFEAYRRCMEERTPQQVEARFTFADGSSAWYEAKAEPVPDGIFVLSQDITQRKRVEEDLRRALAEAEEGKRTLQALMDSVPEGITIADAKGLTVRMVSRYGQELLGAPHNLPAAEVARQWPVLHPDGESIMDLEELPLTRAIRHGEVVRDVELIQVNSRGDRLPLLCNAAPIRDERGDIIGGVVAWRDVTERKEAEEALRESEEKFRQVFDSMADAIQLCELVSDSEGRAVDIVILDTNPAYERHTGLRRDQVVGRRIKEILPVVEQEWLDRYEALVRTGQSIHFDQWNAGVGRWFGVSASALGRNRFVAVFKDITGLKQAEGALRDANDQLREADRRKDEFLAVLSHELRNPLAPIRNSLHLLDHAPPGSDAARRARDVLQRQTGHLARLVDDLLDMSRIAHGKIELQLARIDARDVVRRTCDDIRTVFEQRSVELRFSQATEPVWVDADAARLAQMVGNVVSNALKFTPPGGMVGVTVETRGGACEVSVLDTGIGIAPADIDRIFDQFVSAGRTRHGGQVGLGIGLYLVRELARMHGGAVRARSAGVGLGAEFVLTLPLATAPPDDAGRRRTEDVASTLSVLIVEDNQDAAASLADLLTLSAHRVHVVATGKAGIEEVRARAPDLLICDLGLPDVNGFEVIRSVRAAGSTVFSIALTGYAQPQDRELALAAGFDAHLAKPPRLDRLNELLAEVARRKA